MIRNSVLASLVALALSSSAWAGELDREHTGTPVPAKVTFKASGDVLGESVRSEMDSESPSQSFFWYGARRRAFYGGGYAVGYGGYGGGYAVGYRSAYYGGGGFGYRSAYYGGYPSYGYTSSYYGGYPSYGYTSYYSSYPVYTSSYYVGGFRGGCGW